MTLNFSPSELGLICESLKKYSAENTEAQMLLNDICLCVSGYFSSVPYADEMYSNWLIEYGI